MQPPSILEERLARGPATALTDAGEGWAPHPSFPGVSLKTLAPASMSGGALRTLMVRIAPGGAMLPHTHPEEAEQHLVIAGTGTLTLDGAQHPYGPGALAIIPRAARHSVRADADGMILMAVFAPATT